MINTLANDSPKSTKKKTIMNTKISFHQIKKAGIITRVKTNLNILDKILQQIAKKLKTDQGLAKALIIPFSEYNTQEEQLSKHP